MKPRRLLTVWRGATARKTVSVLLRIMSSGVVCLSFPSWLAFLVGTVRAVATSMHPERFHGAGRAGELHPDPQAVQTRMSPLMYDTLERLGVRMDE